MDDLGLLRAEETDDGNAVDDGIAGVVDVGDADGVVAVVAVEDVDVVDGDADGDDENEIDDGLHFLKVVVDEK